MAEPQLTSIFKSEINYSFIETCREAAGAGMIHIRLFMSSLQNILHLNPPQCCGGQLRLGDG